DPASIPARRLLASLLLQGAQVFPFGPSVVQSASQSSTSILRANAHAAIELLESGPQDIFMDVGCARIFATACSVLGRLKEAEEALSWTIRESENGENSSESSSSVSSRTKGDDPKPAQRPLTSSENARKASMFSELGRMSSRTNRMDDAKIHLKKARELDQWSWSAWSGLCDIGMTRTASNKRTVAQTITPSSTTSSLARPGSRTDATIASKRMRTMPSSQPGPQTQKAGAGMNGGRGNVTGRVGTANDPANRPASNLVGAKRSRPVMRSIPTSSSSSSDAESVNVPTGGFTSKSETGPKASDKGLMEIVQTAALEASRQAQEYDAIDAQISELLRTLARAYHAVRNARGRLALALLLYGGLSSIHRNCADIQCLLGRAYHDLGRYHLAEKHFLHARHLSPSFLAHMDIFSLSLFHLQREVRLSQLVKELQLLDPTSSITHIAAGNAFALQHEHSAALRSFQKACSAAPNHAYAFTLAGYEASELGDKEKSLQYFREAIRIEKRHWNAYAGIGQIHLQEEKLNAASYYYGQALELQRSNAVLWDIFGRIKMAQGILGEAERSFECALRLDNNSAMSHIKMAETLLRRSTVENDHSTLIKQHERAHNHLLKAVKLAPDEAHVHLMLAKSYMDKGTGSFATLLRNGNRNTNTVASDREDVKDGPEEQQIRATGQATLPNKYRAEIAQHLSTAIDLNPRLSRYVKAMGEGARAALRG
ncbi:TPR-like protein, partial [Meira miltonrushii]